MANLAFQFQAVDFLAAWAFIGGRALDGYFVVQIQSPGSPNSSWLEANSVWVSASSFPPLSNSSKMFHFCRPVRTSFPVDANCFGVVC